MIRDSRRLPGIHLLANEPGAILDVTLRDEDDERIGLWRAQLARMLAALGWTGNAVRWRRFPGGASLFFSAPPDALYSSTEINEWAWRAAEMVARGEAEPPLEPELSRLKAELKKEQTPDIGFLLDAAKRHNVSCNIDHKAFSVGSGTGSQMWPAPDRRRPGCPPPVRWGEVHDVPTVLVTGSNGKTTTVRLMASVVRASGKVPGYCTTDHVVIGQRAVEEGDWSGPMGARAVLRNRQVEVAILETARGGILRRGLASTKADAAIVTNIAEDHFGEWGITNLMGIAETKLVVGRIVPRLVLNAEDDVLMETVKIEKAKGRITADLGLFALDAGHPRVSDHIAVGNTAAVLYGGDLLFFHKRRATKIIAARDVPLSLGGAARYNIANALGVILLASAIGIHRDAIARGLASFKGTPDENPGRSHLFEFGGLKVIVDFAHNPHGMRALIETAQAMPAKRKAVILGQAGDRDDESIRGLATETWPWRPDLVVLKEMERFLRGRKEGESTTIIRDEFLRLGAKESMFRHQKSELLAVREALEWAQDGDLVLLPTHAERDAVLALMQKLQHSGWRAGQPLP